MIALVTGLLFVGYLLVYAAVANGGRFADHPWDALLASAYDNDPTSAAATGGGGGKSALEKIAGAAAGLIPGPWRVWP